MNEPKVFPTTSRSAVGPPFRESSRSLVVSGTGSSRGLGSVMTMPELVGYSPSLAETPYLSSTHEQVRFGSLPERAFSSSDGLGRLFG